MPSTISQNYRQYNQQMNRHPLHRLPRLQVPRVEGDLRSQIMGFLLSYDRADTAGHCSRVAAEAKRIAKCYGLDGDAAETAGLLHDISAVVPNEERIALAEEIGLAVLEAERAYPMIVHQRLSEVMAETIFGVANPEVLSAIGCHTTLKRGASALDMAVFVADKIKWDQAGDPPYLAEITVAAEHSLEAAAYTYLQYLFRRSKNLKVVHPWAWDAYVELGNTHSKRSLE